MLQRQAESEGIIRVQKDGEVRALIVEDDLALKSFWEFLFHKHWPTVVIQWAVSGETAIDWIQASTRLPPFDLIVTDIFLSGGLTGLDIVESIREAGWRRDCEVVLCSSCDPDKIRNQLRSQDPYTHVIAKPYNPERCAELLNGFIER